MALTSKFSIAAPVEVVDSGGFLVRQVDVNGVALDDGTTVYSVAAPVMPVDSSGANEDGSLIFSTHSRVTLSPTGHPVVRVDVSGNAVSTAFGGVTTGGSYPASVNSATWSATAKTVYDLSSTANTGYRTAPTKTAVHDGSANDPAVAVANVSWISGILTLGAGGGTFSGWTLGDYEVDVTGSGWTIQDNFFAGGASRPSYALKVTGNSATVCYNSFDGNYGLNFATAIYIGGTAANAKFYRNRIQGTKSDSAKILTSITDATKPQIYENYWLIGGWDTAANAINVGNGSLNTHYDCITHALGGALYQHNLFDLSPYIDPANVVANGLDSNCPVNPVPSGTPAGYFTWGLTSVLRCQDDTVGGTMDGMVFNQNICKGFKRGGFNPFSIVDNQTELSFAFTDNIIEEGEHNGVSHPNIPADPGFSLTWTGNTRYSDGATFTDRLGTTTVAPSPPVLAYIGNVTDTGFTIFFDRGGDTGANGGHNYALSTDGGTTWGSWTATSGAVTGLSAGTTYSVKMQAVNGNGTSADSNILTQLTTGTAVTLSGTTYTFDTDRTDLALEPGWTLHYGSAGAILPASGVVKKGVSANADNFYREGALVSSGSQRVGFTFNISGSTVNRVAVLGSGSQGAFVGYEMFPSAATAIRVSARYSDGTSITLGTVTVASSLAAFQLEGILGSPSNTINLYDGSGSLLATYTDSNALRSTGGYNGLRTGTTAAIVNTGDTFIGNIH